MTAAKCTFASPRALLRIERILAALKANPMTNRAMAAKIHCARPLANIYIAHLQEKPNRRVRIVDYEKTTGQQAPIYGLGKGPDAPFVKQSRAEQRKARIGSDKHAAELERRRVKHQAKRAALPPEQIKRKRKSGRTVTLQEQVAAMVIERPGYTSTQLATVLNEDANIVSNATAILYRRGLIAPKDASGRRRWISLTSPPTELAPPPVKITAQSWLSALM